MSESVRSIHGVSRFAPSVAISAVQFDSRLVADIMNRLMSIGAAAPSWRGHPSEAFSDATLHREEQLVLVLHQRLWGRDALTAADSAELRARAGLDRSRFVRVLPLDDEPVPEWLVDAGHVEPRGTSIDDVIARLVGARDPLPASLAHSTATQTPSSPPSRTWDTPLPFLDQPRSLSVLRQALDDVSHELAARVRDAQREHGDHYVELLCVPNRFVVQFGDVGLTFSWVPSRLGAVGDGRLLVIEWSGTVAQTRRPGTIRSASAGRERVFQPDATGPADWCWRAVDATGVSYSSRDLAAQAFAGALLTVGA